MKLSHLPIIPSLAILSSLPAVIMVASSSPQDPAIDVAAFKSDSALNALFADLGAVLNKPASDVQQHTLDALTTPEMNALLVRLKDGHGTTGDAEAQHGLDRAFRTAIEASLRTIGEERRFGEGDEKTKGKGQGDGAKEAKRDAVEGCVAYCVNIKTQSCALLEGTNPGEKSCAKETVREDCVESCKA
ncbi:hypothetical protein PMIN04_008128 [Paraphaeosphaeria minitans]